MRGEGGDGGKKPQAHPMDAMCMFGLRELKKAKEHDAKARASGGTSEEEDHLQTGLYRLPAGTSPASEQLCSGIQQRTVTVADLGRLFDGPDGADANLHVSVPSRDKDGERTTTTVSILGLAIDDVTGCSSLMVWGEVPEIDLPTWPSREMQAAVLEALIQKGALIEGLGVRGPRGSKNPVTGVWPDDTVLSPIKLAIRRANMEAFEVFVKHGASLQGQQLIFVPFRPCPTPTSRQYEENLMATIGRLLAIDSTLAAESIAYDGTNEDIAGTTAVHHIAQDCWPEYSTSFIIAYLDLLVAHGASLNEENFTHGTPMTDAITMAGHCSLVVAEYLCRHLTLAQLDRKPHSHLATISGLLADDLQHGCIQKDVRDEETIIKTQKLIIRALLRAGACIDTMRPPDFDQDSLQKERRVVLHEYASVLHLLARDVMDAVNKALKPHRDLAALLTHLLPLAPHHDGDDPSPSSLSLGPHEAALLAWRIAAFNFDGETAQTALNSIALRSHFALGKRIHKAMSHFVTCAATKTASNKEVVGGVMEVRGQTVSIPPLQCFAVSEGGSKREIGLREVVHKARMDEASKYGITGITKGFNEHLAGDCVFEWPQLGYCDKKGCFVSMAIE
ncbi:unnamed protein product [Vitrella brassicaformis CCMP3155]|uniref:Uncharacterized protein n=1 Tax=Vitrella brassicaformis (strain CCMP3155) TaxID=1169540 RepID=A0A0G4EEB2_VITBC|nr:unnamed protein product [Vitrella brassicaformis CCMP3155]|eukprot:CEL93894.1 unnamed protein product [Vitrella brassicaformis CCMP3155]